MKLDDLPPNLREQAIRQLAPSLASAKPAPPARTRQNPPRTPHKPAAPCGGNLTPYAPKTRQKPRFRPPSGMTQTEADYNAEALSGKGRFEPVTFRLLGGVRYTPDFLTIDDGIPTFHEVKGSYRLQSEGRAWTAFNSAAAQFPFFRWVWAVRTTKPKGWTVKRLVEPVEPVGIPDSFPAACNNSADIEQP